MSLMLVSHAQCVSTSFYIWSKAFVTHLANCRLLTDPDRESGRARVAECGQEDMKEMLRRANTRVLGHCEAKSRPGPCPYLQPFHNYRRLDLQ